MKKALLQVQDLNTYFKTDEGLLTAVNGIDFSIWRGETLGLVGESGCGKSVSALSIMRLIPEPPGRIVKGRILFEGQDLVQMNEAEMRRIRGNAISMIFQEPMTSLNPVHRIGNQIAEAIKLHQKVDQAKARRRAVEILGKVGIPDPQRRAREYPFQLSGGMRQRVMIAMALSCNPKLIIADEPTTALDVTIQAQILDLMKKLQEDFGAAILLITHDLGVIAEVAERVAVMYAGRIVEMAAAKPLFTEPMHPYTQGLMASMPHLDRSAAPDKLLKTISGMVPSLLNLPPGCTFQDRCEWAFERCRSQEPPLIEVGSKRSARCWLYG